MKASKKLVTSFIVLAITLVFAGATTFAWFSMNLNVSVGNIDSTVTTGTDGLYISLEENGAYVPNISFVDTANVNKTEGKYDIADIMNPTAAEGALAFDMRDVTYDSVTHKMVNEKNVAAVGGKNGNYINYTLYFRSDTALTIMLMKDTGVTAENPAKTYVSPKGEVNPAKLKKAWITEASADVYGQALVTGESLSTRAAYATRVGFKDTEAATTVDPTIWEPNSELGFKSTATRNVAQDYKFRLTNPTTALPTTILKPSYEANAKKADAIYAEELLVLKLKDGFFTGSLQITVWIEGCDNDCLNSILTDSMSIGLQFTSKTIAA